MRRNRPTPDQQRPGRLPAPDAKGMRACGCAASVSGGRGVVMPVIVSETSGNPGGVDPGLHAASAGFSRSWWELRGFTAGRGIPIGCCGSYL